MTDELADCQQKLTELEHENAQLRSASSAFGELAERLSEVLQQERRSGQERRVEIRPLSDRRNS